MEHKTSIESAIVFDMICNKPVILKFWLLNIRFIYQNYIHLNKHSVSEISE